MGLQLERLGVDHPDFHQQGRTLLERVAKLRDAHARFTRLWAYYLNPMSPVSPAGADARPYTLGQEWGLPQRITGNDDVSRKSVVIENDIAWRIDTMVDWLFGRPVTLRSLASDSSRREAIESVVRTTLGANGGLGFFQKLALLGAVYGQVDVLVKLAPPGASGDAGDVSQLGEQARPAGIDFADVARRIHFEIVEPARALPMLMPTDPTRAVAFAQVYRTSRPSGSRSGWWNTLVEPLIPDPDQMDVIEIHSPTRWQRYEDLKLVAEGTNPTGELPMVHVQNLAMPFQYAGLSDVQQLIPLQDELNERLSDRAHRIAMQSSKMYFGKGIENFKSLSIGPGQLWESNNPDAVVQEIGGDQGAPSEDAHIEQLREALDKVSGVPPIAAGITRNRIGRLTSAAALKLTLHGLVARTQRKRTTYGPAVARLGSLALAWLDATGVFRTDPSERALDIDWPAAVPIDFDEKN
jgi:hypothetical protein